MFVTKSPGAACTLISLACHTFYPSVYNSLSAFSYIWPYPGERREGSEMPLQAGSSLRRGKFVRADAATNKGWNIAEWKGHLDLLPFNPKTEMELEAWFEDAAFKLIANGATAAITLQVMQLLWKPR